MNPTQQSDRDRHLRKAAILLASLDVADAERMVAELPADEAEAVRLAMTRLDVIDPEEQDDIVEQFRRSTRLASPRARDGVELDASLLARFEQQSLNAWDTTLVREPKPWEVLSDAEAATIVDALSREHPQTVAVVISRIEPAAAAAILSRLSSTLQTDVLGRLAELDPADEQSVQVVESHLAQWINRQRERKHRLAAGVELVGRILESTPTGERTAILTRLGSAHPDLAQRIGQPATATKPSPDSRPKPSAARKKSPHPGGGYKPLPRLALPLPPTPPTIADPLRELERLDDATLMATLTQADRQVATLALAGASEELIGRILRRLPRRQAKAFRRWLCDIGPTRLSDMFAAQQQLAHQARQLRPR